MPQGVHVEERLCDDQRPYRHAYNLCKSMQRPMYQSWPLSDLLGKRSLYTAILCTTITLSYQYHTCQLIRIVRNSYGFSPILIAYGRTPKIIRIINTQTAEKNLNSDTLTALLQCKINTDECCVITPTDRQLQMAKRAAYEYNQEHP